MKILGSGWHGTARRRTYRDDSQTTGLPRRAGVAQARQGQRESPTRRVNPSFLLFFCVNPSFGLAERDFQRKANSRSFPLSPPHHQTESERGSFAFQPQSCKCNAARSWMDGRVAFRFRRTTTGMPCLARTCEATTAFFSQGRRINPPRCL